jgi:hypothetical protein
MMKLMKADQMKTTTLLAIAAADWFGDVPMVTNPDWFSFVPRAISPAVLASSD